MGGGSPEEQSRRTQEQIVVEKVISTVDEEVFVAVRQHGWMCTEKGLWLACESAGDSTGGRAHSPTAMLFFFFLEIFFGLLDVVSLPVVETQKSQKERERRRPS